MLKDILDLGYFFFVNYKMFILKNGIDIIKSIFKF